MPKGLTELIEYILEQIALCGEHGASISDYKRFVEEFYSLNGSTLGASVEQPTFKPPPKGYGRIQQLAWEWLTQNPEIWVGKDKEGNALSLDQLEVREAKLLQSSRTQQANSQQPAAGKQKAVEDSKGRKPLRIWTTRDRVWKTLTGHGVDFKRIPPMEFTALSYIAAAGQKGILQPDLIHGTGQDKRSLPKRTDNLAKNGYIDKKAVMLKSQKTSLLRLARWASTETSEVFGNGRLVLDNFLQNLCEWVKEGDSIALSEVEEKLNCAAPGWEKTMLWRALERLDIIGVIERFHRPMLLPAKKDPNKSTATLRKPKFVRLKCMPTEEHKQRYYKITGKDRDAFRQRLEMQDAEAKNEHAEYGKDDEEYTSVETLEAAPDSSSVPNTVGQNERGQATLQWDPDLPYTNNVVNVLEQVANGDQDLRENSYGHFYARAVDQILGRLTDDWEKSQPSNLRHLNVIRDTGSTGKYSHYLYRTYPQFQKAVNEGQTSWETVSHDHRSRPNDQPLDEWGFPRIPASSLLNNGRATLGECLASARIPAEPVSVSDPVLVTYTDGTTGAQWGTKATTAPQQKTPVVRSNATARQAPATKRPKGAKGTSVVMDFIEKKPGQPVTKDQSAYNAAYRKMQRLQKQAQERAQQIRRQAERVAYEEALSLKDTNSNSEPQSADGRRYIKHIFSPSRNNPALVIVNNTDTGGDMSDDGNAAVPSSPASNPDNLAAEPQPTAVKSAKGIRKVREKLFVMESRVQELVLQLSDASRNAVHINPPGSLFDEKIGPGRPFKVQHMVVFKFPWLQNFDWFVPESPRIAEPPPISEPSKIAEAPETAEAPQPDEGSQITHEPPQAVTEPPPFAVAANQASDVPIPVDKPDSLLENEAISEERPLTKSTTQAKAKVTKTIPTKKLAGKKSMPAPGVYVQKTRGRPALDGPRKLVLIFKSDRLHELRLTGEVVAVPIAIEEDDDTVQATPRRVSRRSSQADERSQSTTPLPSEKSYVAESPASSQHSDVYIHPSPVPLVKSGPGRRKKGTVLGRGAVALKRELLVMQIVDKCGGMFPGDTEIVGPYQRIQKQTQNTQSDRVTITRAVESLVQTGKLNRIGFEFPANDGKLIKKNVLIKAGIAEDAPELQNMIAEIRKAHPMNFVPEALEDPTHSVPHRTQLNRYLAQERQDGDGFNPATTAKKKVTRNGKQPLPAGNKVGRPRSGRKSSVTFEGDGPAALSHEDKNSGPPSDLKTLGELLAKIGSFAPDHDADPTHEDPMDEDVVLPSIEQDANAVTRGRIRSRVSYRVPVEEDFWISENPKDTNYTRGLPTERSSSAYSPDPNETGAHHDHGLESTSEDKARWTVKKTLARRKRRRLNDEDDDEELEPNEARFAGYHRSFEGRALGRTDTHKTVASRNTLVHDVLTFKEPIGPQTYNPNYQWQRLRSLLDPDQQFYAKSGTFSTEFFVLRNVEESAWVEPPRGPIVFEHVSSTNETDIQNLLDVDDFDSHYHPDKLQNKHTLKKPRFYYEDSDDDCGDEIERAWFERQELELMRQQYPGLTFAKKSDGFLNYSLSHDLEVSKEPLDPKARKYKARTIVYGAQEKDIASIRNQQQSGVRVPNSRAPAKSRNGGAGGQSSLAAGSYTGNKVTAKQSGNCFIPAQVAKRLLFVTIAIRALVGGVDQTIRWQYIIEVFQSHPNFDPPTFKARWLRMLNNHRVLVDQLEQEFREKFLVAYARGEVQATDVRDYGTYDWGAIGDWAMENIPVYPEDITLPSTRDMLDASYDITVTPRDTQEQRERMDHPMATNMARAQYTGDLLFALPLRPKKTRKNPTTAKTVSGNNLQIAKSWARACSATRDADFDPRVAEAKLQTLPDAILKEALEELHADKLISHQFKGRIRNGRAFRLADTYNSALFTKRQLEPQHFLEAVAFKKYLDSRFSGGEKTILLQGGFKDGDIMVLTELSANGRLELRPMLPPVNSKIGDSWPRLSVWGFSEGHYRLRNLDKRTFYWDVEISKTASYVYGLPKQQKLSSMRPPRGPMLSGPGKELIPMWYDIHGNVVQSYWSNMVRCVVQAAAFHAGCSMENLTAAFKGFIWDWEVQLVVQWLLDLGVVKWMGGHCKDDGLMVCEWWWSIVPDAPEEEKVARPAVSGIAKTKPLRSRAARSLKNKGKAMADDDFESDS
ncbi:tfiiic transcription initiation factor complex subunits tfc3 [Venturia nashicola]|nr:tfiiic transcription initiation factor complex subunits tfc3 [Venturia nashicola]